jgi:hypothetical protein
MRLGGRDTKSQSVDHGHEDFGNYHSGVRLRPEAAFPAIAVERSRPSAELL